MVWSGVCVVGWMHSVAATFLGPRFVMMVMIGIYAVLLEGFGWVGKRKEKEK